MPVASALLIRQDLAHQQTLTQHWPAVESANAFRAASSETHDGKLGSTVVQKIARGLSIAFWISVRGLAVFFVAGVGVFAWFRGEARFLATLCTVVGLIALAICIYAIRVRFRFREDWRGLSPREIGARVYFVLFNGPKQTS